MVEMITIGNVLLYASFVVGMLSSIAILLYEFMGIDFSKYLSWALRLAACLLSSSMLLLIYYFVSSDFSVFSVWRYSSVELPLIYKISAVWAGQEGTYLLWAWAVFLFIWWTSEKRGWDSPLIRRTLFVALLVGNLLLVLTLMISPFKSIFDLASPQVAHVPLEGYGLNPVYTDPLFAFHPPVVFIAYAALTIPFSAALVYQVTREAGWEQLSRQWCRISWLFLTLGMGLGGLWAYKLIDWGGYWNWDPVLSATIIVWLSLTATLHALPRFRVRGEFPVAAPLLTMFTFILCIYTTYVTRSGVIPSLHGFEETVMPTRYLLVVTMLLAAIITIALGVKAGMQERKRVVPLISATNMFYLTIVLLYLLVIVSFWGISSPMFLEFVTGMKISIAKEFFNVWSYPFMVPLVILLGVCVMYGRVERKLLMWAVVLVVSVSSIGLAFVTPTIEYMLVDPTGEFYLYSSSLVRALGSASLLSYVPVFLFATGAIIFRFMKDIKAARERTVLVKLSGVHLIHLGVTLIVLGAILSTSFGTTTTVTYRLDEIGKMKDVGSLGIKLVDFEISPDLMEPVQTASVHLYENGALRCIGAATFWEDRQYGAITNIMLDRGGLSDVHVIFQGIRPRRGDVTIPLTIKVMPFINVLWGGMVLFLMGICFILASEYAMEKRRGK